MTGKQLTLLGGSFGPPPAYQIQRSLRFNSADSADLSRTPASASNRKTFTVSVWLKRSSLASRQGILTVPVTGSLYWGLEFDSSNSIIIYDSNAGGGTDITTSAAYRDLSAWYHIVVAVDTTQATASNRVKLYVNGTQVTAFSSANYPTQNSDTYINSTSTHRIGSWVSVSTLYFNGYMTEFYLIDGQALTPSSFGQTNSATGVWEPIAYTGTYGTNGFYLDFVGPTTVAGQLYKSSTLYTTKTDILANATAISGGASISSEYLYFVPNSNATTGTNVFTSNGSMNDTTRYFYRSGGSWVQTSGSYGTTEFTSMLYGTDSSNYRLSASRDFYLLSSSTGQAAATGTVPTLRTELIIEDQSGNNNDWAANNISTTAGTGNDSLVDTPTPYGTDTGAGGEVRGNYCTLNPLDNGGLTLSNGNLQFDRATASWISARSTVGMSSGKWYWEVVQTTGTSMMVGISKNDASQTSYVGAAATGWAYNSGDGNKYNNSSNSAYGNTYTTNDVIGVAFDADSGDLKFYKNGTVQNSGTAAYTGLTSGPYFPAVSLYGTATAFINFGQRPFAYTAPSGFKALVTQNLPTPTVIQGDDYFNTVLWTGNGASSRAITGVGFQPDWVWDKMRSDAYQHAIVDSVRGGNKVLHSNSTAAEDVNWTYGYVSSFDSDGFTIQAGSTSAENWNLNAATFVAWCWKANGTGSSNTQGTITSTVSANTTSGFSIVTYTGNGTSNSSVGHGLGATPVVAIIKSRSQSGENWHSYWSVLGQTKDLQLNTTDAEFTYTSPNIWGSTSWSSTLFYLGNQTGINSNGSTYVAYCFAPVAGFSAFGSYVGNGSSNGPFVYTGFRPKWILIRPSDSVDNWQIQDTARSPYNVVNDQLWPNLSDAEQVDSITRLTDFLSNGFKLRGSNPGVNGNAINYIYAAFAENPFKYALAR